MRISWPGPTQPSAVLCGSLKNSLISLPEVDKVHLRERAKLCLAGFWAGRTVPCCSAGGAGSTVPHTASRGTGDKGSTRFLLREHMLLWDCLTAVNVGSATVIGALFILGVIQGL